MLILESHLADSMSGSYRMKNKTFPTENNSTCWITQPYSIISECHPCSGKLYPLTCPFLNFEIVVWVMPKPSAFMKVKHLKFTVFMFNCCGGHKQPSVIYSSIFGAFGVLNILYDCSHCLLFWIYPKMMMVISEVFE